MIETHIHILPQIDDGPKVFPETLKMLKKLKDSGYKKIIATPHFWKDYWEPDKKEIKEKVDTVNKAIKELNWNLTIFPGSEIRLTPQLFEKIGLKNLQTLNNSKYILLDVFPDFKEENIKQLDFLLENKLIPIIAHPERYPAFDTLKRITELKEKGILFQLVSKSLKDNRKTREKVNLFLKNNIYDLIGSDSHLSNDFYSLEQIKTVFEHSRIELLHNLNCDKIFLINN